MNPSPSNRTPSSDGPRNPGHLRPAVRPRRRGRAALVAAAGIVFTVLGVARAFSAGPDDPRSDGLVWWGAGVLLLLGPSASLLAVVLVVRGIRSDLDLRLRDLSGPWPPPDPYAGRQRRGRPGVLGPAIDISEATGTLVGARPGHPVRADRWTPAGPPSDPPRRARLDVMVVVDVSSSMARTDPTAHRFWAARHLVGLLTAEPGLRGPSAETGDDRVGVVLFADRPLTAAPLVPVAGAAGRRLVADALVPCQGRGTAIAAALAHAAEQFTRRPGALPVVLLFTDGRSPDPVEHLILAARAFPRGSLHVLAPGDLPLRWDHVPAASVVRTGPSPDAAAALEAHLVRILLGTSSLAWHQGMT
jgi:hypothetical protein